MNHKFTVLESIDQYNELIERQKKKGASNINLFMLADEISRLIQRNQLLYRESDEGLLLFADNGFFYRLYLYANLDATLCIEPADQPILAEFPGHNTLSANAKKMIAKLEERGFSCNASSIRMSMRCDAIEAIGLKKPCLPGLDIRTAQADHIPHILALWNTVFDPLVNLLPPLDEIESNISQGNILCAIENETNRLAGVIQTEIRMGASWIWHEAVSPDFQGKGVGQALSYTILENAIRKNVMRHCLWIVETNEVARRFHSKFGYQPDGRISKQYLLNPK